MPKILLVDDHPIFLDGLKQFLETYDGFEILCATSAEETAALMTQSQFDLLLLDVTVIGGGGMEILKSIREDGSQVPIIFLTVHIDPQDTVEAMRLGINGIILKESAPDEIIDAVQKVLIGQTHFDPAVTEKALHHSVENPTDKALAQERLTMREREIIEFVAEGLRNREIADKCSLTEGTVKTHLHNIFGKMGVKSRTQLLIALGEISKDG